MRNLKMPPWNILVLPASTPRAAVIAQSLCGCKEVSLFGADDEINPNGPLLFQNFLTLPSLRQESSLSTLLTAIEENAIHALCPADEETSRWLVALGEKIPVPVVNIRDEDDFVLQACACGQNLYLQSFFQEAGVQVETMPSLPPVAFTRTTTYRFLNDAPIDALYIDFDETLVLNGQVNTQLVALLYQCVNRQIPIHLLTKHPGDLHQALETHRLLGLFDSVTHMPSLAESNKADHIKETHAVLIDDSFQERLRARKAHPSLRCLDVAAALCLLDMRI